MFRDGGKNRTGPGGNNSVAPRHEKEARVVCPSNTRLGRGAKTYAPTAVSSTSANNCTKVYGAAKVSSNAVGLAWRGVTAAVNVDGDWSRVVSETRVDWRVKNLEPTPARWSNVDNGARIENTWVDTKCRLGVAGWYLSRTRSNNPPNCPNKLTSWERWNPKFPRGPLELPRTQTGLEVNNPVTSGGARSQVPENGPCTPKYVRIPADGDTWAGDKRVATLPVASKARNTVATGGYAVEVEARLPDAPSPYQKPSSLSRAHPPQPHHYHERPLTNCEHPPNRWKRCPVIRDPRCNDTPHRPNKSTKLTIQTKGT